VIYYVCMGFIHSVEHLGYVRHACSSHNSNSVIFYQIYQIVYIADQFNDQRNYLHHRSTTFNSCNACCYLWMLQLLFFHGSMICVITPYGLCVARQEFLQNVSWLCSSDKLPADVICSETVLLLSKLEFSTPAPQADEVKIFYTWHL